MLGSSKFVQFKMNSKYYKCCTVPDCPSSTFQTPGKLFIHVPRSEELRKEWLRLAGKDPQLYSKTSKMHFCEDHFDMPNDMENYTEYRLLGSVSQIRMRAGCLPSKFDLQIDSKSSIKKITTCPLKPPKLEKSERDIEKVYLPESVSMSEDQPGQRLAEKHTMANQYMVRWDGYQSNLQAAFEQQFLDENFVDVTLAVEEGLIKCHRMVLCAASGYFKQLFGHHACSHPIIYLKDMQYWELIALVDFMYRGEVSLEEDKLEQLMKSAHTLQMHGLSAVLIACMQRLNKQVDQESQQDGEEEIEDEVDDDAEESQESGGAADMVETISRLNDEVELRPIPHPSGDTDEHCISDCQKNIVKEEIDFEDQSCPSPIEVEPVIQIQDVYSERLGNHEENSNDIDVGKFMNIEQETPDSSRIPQPEQMFHKFLFIRPTTQAVTAPNIPSHTNNHRERSTISDLPLYKRYSPKVLEQALTDLQTGRFNSIRACARHHGIPMTTLRYRAKGHSKRPSWLPGLNETM